jgi:hypothetical protein
LYFFFHFTPKLDSNPSTTTEAGVFNKSPCIAADLGVTIFTYVRYMNLGTLLCYLGQTWTFNKPYPGLNKAFPVLTMIKRAVYPGSLTGRDASVQLTSLSSLF